ncbi:MAG: hypothetical protein AAGH48_07815 [Pseudomonadota bacterium]
MAAFRYLSWIVVALALMLLGADVMTSLERGGVEMRSVADILSMVGVDLGGAGKKAPGGAGQALAAVLGVPMWAVLGAIGTLLVLVFRPMD